MLTNILIGAGILLVLALAALAVLIARQPEHTVITRSATMNAPPERVFEQVNNLRNWGDWSPWAKKDPEQRIAFEGPEAGAGAAFSWAGNKEVGEGRIEIVESDPGRRVKIRLDFLKPMQVTNTAEYSFEPEGSGTRVTWTMTCNGEKFMAKVFSLMMDMDKMIGADFEKGLASMREIVEAPG